MSKIPCILANKLIYYRNVKCEKCGAILLVTKIGNKYIRKLKNIAKCTEL